LLYNNYAWDHCNTYLWHESAAWNLAIGAGFLWIATRRGRPTGALPILTAFVAMLVLLSASDVIAGRVDTARLISHAFLLTGYAVIVALTRPSLDLGPPPTGPDHRTWRWRVHFDTDDESVPAQPSPPTAARPAEGTTHHAA
jgi:predicted anti-sigma-YlaC factor YlaD